MVKRAREAKYISDVSQTQGIILSYRKQLLAALLKCLLGEDTDPVLPPQSFQENL